MGLGEAKSPRSSFAGEPCTYQIIGSSKKADGKNHDCHIDRHDKRGREHTRNSDIRIPSAREGNRVKQNGSRRRSLPAFRLSAERKSQMFLCETAFRRENCKRRTLQNRRSLRSEGHTSELHSLT